MEAEDGKVLIIGFRWLARSKKVNNDPLKAEPKLLLTKYLQASHTLLDPHLQGDTREQRKSNKPSNEDMPDNR